MLCLDLSFLHTHIDSVQIQTSWCVHIINHSESNPSFEWTKKICFGAWPGNRITSHLHFFFKKKLGRGPAFDPEPPLTIHHYGNYQQFAIFGAPILLHTKKWIQIDRQTYTLIFFKKKSGSKLWRSVENRR